MFNKLLLAFAFVAAGMFVTDNQASADHCRYGGGYNSYRPSVSVRSFSPGYSAYRVPTRSYYGGYGISPRSSSYRGGFGSPYYGGGFGSPFYGGGFGSPIYGGGRGGISIGFGF